MKTKNALFVAVILTIVFTLTVFGQPKIKLKKPVINKNDVASVLGKPVYESTVDSLNTKIWIITQKKYKTMQNTKMGKLMGKMDNKMKMDNATKEAVLTGTHYFIFDVSNITNGKQFADTSAKVDIVSPTKIVSSVNLQPMMNHFGGGVTLGEKGEYLFTINLNVGLNYKTSQFKYKLK